MKGPRVPDRNQWRDVLDLEGWEEAAISLSADVSGARLQLLDLPEPEAMNLELHLQRTGIPGAYEYRLRGGVTGAMKLTCVRCLADFSFPVDARFDLRYLPASILPPDDEQEHEHELVDGEVDIEYYRRPVFDLLAFVREQVYLALPMDPVCREACAGLCPRCGADRNLGEHVCTESAFDPRWQALRGLGLESKN